MAIDKIRVLKIGESNLTYGKNDCGGAPVLSDMRGTGSNMGVGGANGKLQLLELTEKRKGIRSIRGGVEEIGSRGCDAPGRGSNGCAPPEKCVLGDGGYMAEIRSTFGADFR